MSVLSRCLLVLATLAVVSMTASLAAGKDKDKKIKTKVTIVKGDAKSFIGFLTAKNNKCLEKRWVKLMRKDSAGDKSKPEVAGKTMTNAKGRWTIGGSFIAGYYYAKVDKKTVGKGPKRWVCAPGFSPGRYF